MSTYTEFKFTAQLSKDTHKEVIEILEKTITRGDIGIGENQLFKNEDVPRPTIGHPFFDCPNWYGLFLCNNWDDTRSSKFYQQNTNSSYTLEIHSEFKNYNDEINKFIAWITPYVLGRKKKQYVGFYKIETFDQPINIYIERRFENNKMVKSRSLFVELTNL